MFKLLCVYAISLAIMLCTMPFFISYLKKIRFNQTVSEYSLDAYKAKKSTPTMGGVLFVLIPILVSFILNPHMNASLALILLTFAGYGLIGFLDDYIIVIQRDNQGLKPNAKLGLQVALAVLFFYVFYDSLDTTITIPLFKTQLDLGWLYAPLVYFMFAGASNAVNITDGMDGLATGCSIIAFIPFLIFAWLQGNMQVCIFLVSLLGALTGFLYYNHFPAKIFMGDAGSLALGAALAAVSIVLKKELLLIIIGGVFVWETVCVMAQLTSVKLTGKRIFKSTPIHYDFLLSGLKEVTVVRSFWIIGAVCAVVGLIIGLL